MMFYNIVLCLFIKLLTMVKANSSLPRITAMNFTKIIDNRYDVNCYVNSSEKPNVTWYRNGKILANGPRDRFISLDQQQFVFKLRKDYPSDGEKYTCEVANKYGATNCTIPFYTEEDQQCAKIENPGVFNITINYGATRTLSCSMLHPDKNHGSYIIQPRTNNTNHLYNIYEHHDHRIINYTIVNATLNDTGVYTCFYSTIFKQSSDCNTLNKTFYVFVKGLPLAVPVKTKNIYVALAVSFVGALTGLGLVFLACYLHKSRLKSKRFYDSVPELRWDVFVSYSSKDFSWVKELCETLEQPPFNLSVCLHQRDWELGRTVLDNMTDSVYCSYKTLLIVSKSYLESNYCMQELQLAVGCEMGSAKDHRDKILVIKIDDISMKKLPKTLRQKSYLDFSNSEERRHYKTKLLKALPRREVTDMVEDDSSGAGDSDGSSSVQLCEMVNTIAVV